MKSKHNKINIFFIALLTGNQHFSFALSRAHEDEMELYVFMYFKRAMNYLEIYEDKKLLG